MTLSLNDYQDLEHSIYATRKSLLTIEGRIAGLCKFRAELLSKLEHLLKLKRQKTEGVKS